MKEIRHRRSADIILHRWDGDGKLPDFSGLHLRGADLREWRLDGARFRQANLSGADLRGADLTGADLQGANLTGADLRGTRLAGVDLQGARLTGTLYDSGTSWPQGFEPQGAGAMLAD
jgi:uncharacterized protein YjbI with pentapeptide repeats